MEYGSDTVTAVRNWPAVLSSKRLMRRPAFASLPLALASFLLIATLGARAGATGVQSTSTTPPADFPAGPNRELVVKLCKDCHPIPQITRRRESRAKWSATVEQMIKEGADIRDEDFDKLVVYLSVVLGKKVKINAAPAAVVAETFEIEDELAAAVVKYRTENGPFKTWKDIAAVPGMDAARVEEQKDNLDFGTSP
jgi:competence protein ComEA